MNSSDHQAWATTLERYENSAQLAPVPITSRSRQNLMEVAIDALTLSGKMLPKSQLLAELHKALKYELLVHVLPAETFPVNEIIKLYI